MLFRVQSAAVFGINAYPVSVQTLRDRHAGPAAAVGIQNDIAFLTAGLDNTR